MIKNKYIGCGLIFSLILTAVFAFAVPADAQERGKKHRKGKLNFIFNKMDANADGQVSNQEATNFHQAKFLEIDTNADGFVTISEAKAHRKKMRQEFKASLLEE